MPHFLAPLWRLLLVALLALPFSLRAQAPAAGGPLPYDSDTKALLLARKYLAGGEESRPALMEALALMGWGVRGATGDVVTEPPANANTGLALRDYEIEELLWKPSEQPTIRFISYAQAISVPFQSSDPEQMAQDVLQTIRDAAESNQPQRRFWGKFIIALGRASVEGYDLSSAGSSPLLPPNQAEIKRIQEGGVRDPYAIMRAMQQQPVWPEDDPVLGTSPKPKIEREDGFDQAEFDNKRMMELTQKMSDISSRMAAAPEEKQASLQKEYDAVTRELGAISQRQQNAMLRETSANLNKSLKSLSSDDDEEEEDEDEDEEEDSEGSQGRFVAEFREEPLSLLQVALITKVISADLRLAAKNGRTGVAQRLSQGLYPLATVQLAQTSFGDQFAGAGGDIWATGWGAYTGAVLEHHMPGNKFSGAVGVANTLIAWFKTIMTVARQNITIRVENEPLIRTKTRTAGQQRTAIATVIIDFPKSDVLKAIRAAGNLSTIDLQLPDGGPISGAKVVWRLPEGSYNAKYQTARGGWEYKPELAVVQFASKGGKDAYVSSTDDKGEARITLEGVPQRKNLSNSVREYPRSARVGVEVTLKVGNMTQDLNDAINTAMGGPIGGGLSFIADMVLRTSFFFQKSHQFPVTDWKEPAWEGQFEIIAKASGSKQGDPSKGGPPTVYTWSMDRYMEGRLHTPDWAEEAEQEKDYENEGKHRLDVDGNSRYFRLNDSSSAKSRNVDNRYEATGPIQLTPPGYNRLETFSRSEPSGSATLTFTGGKMILELSPFFGAQCIVGRSESGRGRTVNEAGPQFLSLLDGIYPETFTIVEDNDGSEEFIEGSKTYDNMGSLPYVPNFDVSVTVKYRLWKNGPPPKYKK